ncbi:MAG TPA: hypothetical protein VHC39_16340 [Rhizomicrobium sp.]|nr:hypothetical protein [Rhizomicrobium sp.]
MGGSSSTQTSTTVDPRLMDLYYGNYANAQQNAANYSYVPYTGEMVAGFNPTQQQSFQNLAAAANDPTALNALTSSMNSVNGLLGYQAPTLTAGSVNAPTYSAAQLAGTDLSPYLNPYQNSVINSTMAQLNQQRGQQQVADNAAATAAGAFGGDRQAVQNALTSQFYDQDAASALANLNSANYTQAQQAALADIAARNQASQFNATAGLNAGEFNAGQNLQAQQANAANALSAAQLRGNAATLNAGLGQDYLNQLIQQGGILNNIGAQQQQLQQAQDDAAYQEFMRQISAPLQAQSILNQSLGMIPQQTTTTSNTQSSPGIGGILGGIGSLALGIGTMGTGTLGSALLGPMLGLGSSVAAAPSGIGNMGAGIWEI